MARNAHLDSGRLRFLYVTWAVLETMLFGGLMNGWASLVFILKEDGLYRDLCENNSSLTLLGNGSSPHSSICTEQDAMLNLWFSIATGLRNIFGIVIGLIIFKFGTRVARLLGW
ncbi:large neutral amino acids transporter small subunit 4-like [Pomacea canaliculata]|uniref:large neutral amino acids transporter small subunit 4-like n=1 Tax=Pomacea canaliculata TaxID=400727 RepID=UPI000D73E2D5|nr:large neutral amino acids transporter small subunit 4-like [Pomacea canaliculata]